MVDAQQLPPGPSAAARLVMGAFDIDVELRSWLRSLFFFFTGTVPYQQGISLRSGYFRDKIRLQNISKNSHQRHIRIKGFVASIILHLRGFQEFTSVTVR